MNKVYINASADYVGQDVTIEGWVTHYRSSGKIHFIVVRDGTGVIQCVVKSPDALLEGVNNWSELSQETAVQVRGHLHADKRAPIGVELEVESLKVISLSDNYPIAPKEHGVDFLMDHRHLWIRSPRQAAILRIRAAIIHATRQFLDDNGFIVADPPVITPAAAEGSTTLFPIDYFDDRAYLSQSGQLYMEALAMALGRVYSFGPTFRAEKSKTRRHLMEFWMVEPEMAFCEFEENLMWQEQLVSYIVQYVLETRHNELQTIERDITRLQQVKPPFPRITYNEALERLRSVGFDLKWGEDMGAPHETALAEMFDRPVFVTHFPVSLKAFYMQPDPQNPELALAADMLAPEGYGEIIGGSQRIHDLALLEERIRQHHLDPAVYSWYIDLRRYGSVPHSGFGMGLERVVAWICGLDHVRETIPFARTLNRLWP
ncbi:asparaginyl-tRNA synthetase [Sulfobacillus thermosulfidooxidans DSM 9293]|uniref:Asparagine--tRNA ligase n=2 Tax=Sulfobacillus thermosulfidooxidans TaxID=28034 RepID=A0A1W1WLU2_SULTA|nr:asparagine--tRNA ligase [Sulfobacillus thermosulfidooxidans]PSR29766.1 MAG: asparagine--tRNA ligase [Sulfobacillus thermosulfidooxidans]SMC07149.1 asparaginyl-tRNA synthetase [Sulfobacillus thermosulfidooxidans DSM 9293]